MLSRFMIIVFALTLAATSAQAAEAAQTAQVVPATAIAATPAPAPAAKAAAVEAPVTAPAEGRRLKKRFAVGLDYIPGASTSLPLGGIANVPNSLGLRWWATEKLGLDLRLAMDANSVMQGTTGTASGSTAWGLGLGAKLNLRRPSRDLLAQLIVRASMGGTAQADPGNGQGRASVLETALFVGLGFEAFIPGWDWLSLEGSAGLGLNAQQIRPDSNSNQVSQSSSRLYLGGEGFTPLNLAMHLYF